MALFSASAVFGPKGALSLGIGVKPWVFGSVSRSRILGWETMLVTAAVILSLRLSGLDSKLFS
ncbi:hypothetical protein OAK48_00395 [Deltaproteobacteria bacterium]|nr:hypothetical protein [Deltaproteobacteria bacterium]